MKNCLRLFSVNQWLFRNVPLTTFNALANCVFAYWTETIFFFAGLLTKRILFLFIIVEIGHQPFLPRYIVSVLCVCVQFPVMCGATIKKGKYFSFEKR